MPFLFLQGLCCWKIFNDIEHYLAGSKIFVLSLFIVLSVITTGAMLEQKQWIFHLEFARLILAGIFVCLCYPYFNLGLFLACMIAAITMFYKTKKDIAVIYTGVYDHCS